MNKKLFLPNTSMLYLENLYREEKDATVRTRLQAYMMKKGGSGSADIAERLHEQRTTVSAG